MVAGVARHVPVEFTLRYCGRVPTRSKKEAHRIRCEFEEQLADYWSRDKRLADVKQTNIKRAVQSSRFQFDVRRQELGERVGGKSADRYYFTEVEGVKFVPLVTKWRYLRAEISIRMHRWEGSLHHGGIIEHNGDLDNKCKALIDALRMPTVKGGDCPKGITHARPLFFCVLEDDRLITKLTIEMRNRLGPRPTADKLADVDADIDVRIFPIFPLGTLNYEMLMP
jgi:hypothetical protein